MEILYFGYWGIEVGGWLGGKFGDEICFVFV